MANLGFLSVYNLLNEIDWCVCERAFLPSKEDLDEFKRTETPLFSLESQTPLKDFDILAFSVPFEEDYINIPNILRLSSIPLYSAERELNPLILSGGVGVSLNPEPVADFLDLFFIGEGEGSVKPLLESFMKVREAGLGREDALREFDKIDWIYAPALYDYVYEGARIKERRAAEGVKEKVRAAKNINLDKFRIPENFIITPDSEFKDTFLIEIERGCGRGCRFCAAGFLYLPPRWRDIDAVKDSVERGIKETGKVGLIGTAVSEYPEIKETIEFGVEKDGVVTLSSLRLDKLDTEFVTLLKKGGYRTITLAPEAGNERMRAVINKGITDAEIMESISLISSAGFTKLKLYFLIGLPGETDEDVLSIAELSKKIKGLIKKAEVTLSVNPFIPKPFTPFQWLPLEDADVIDSRIRLLNGAVAKEHGITVSAMGAKEAYLQAFIARADRRASKMIAEASVIGWKKALRNAEPLVRESVYMKRERDEVLPWDLIDHGVKRGYFWKEYQKSLKGEMTPPCDVGNCFRCGVCLPEYFNSKNSSFS